MSLPVEYRAVLDDLWTNFWPHTHLAPLPVLVFIEDLLICKQLDEEETEREKMADYYGGRPKGLLYKKSQQHLRWSQFQQLYWRNLFDLMSRRDGPLQFARSKGKRFASGKLAGRGESFFPDMAKLAEAVKLVSGLQVQNDENRAAMIDYLATKAGMLQPATGSIPAFIGAKGSRPVVSPLNLKPTKTFYLVLLLLSWTGFAGYFSYAHWDELKAMATGARKPAVSRTPAKDSLLTVSSNAASDGRISLPEKKKASKTSQRPKTKKKTIRPAGSDEDSRLGSRSDTAKSERRP